MTENKEEKKGSGPINANGQGNNIIVVMVTVFNEVDELHIACIPK